MYETTFWSEKQSSIRDQTREMKTPQGKLIGDMPYALPIYALLTKMRKKGRRTLDGAFYYLNISNNTIRVPSERRADRCDLSESHRGFPDMHRLLETAVKDLGHEPDIASLRNEMIALRDTVYAAKVKYSNVNEYLHVDMDTQLSPITRAIGKANNLPEMDSFYALSQTILKWQDNIKTQKDSDTLPVPSVSVKFECDIGTFKELIRDDVEGFIPKVIFDLDVERIDVPEINTPMDVIKLGVPTDEVYQQKLALFRNMCTQTYIDFRTTNKIYNAKVKEFETDLENIRLEHKRIYDTYCAETIKDILLIQGFDSII